jgi:hypothetical protein
MQEKMSAPLWFDDLPVIGAMSDAEAIKRLDELGETELAAAKKQSLQRSPQAKSWALWAPRPWEHTSHAFGYLAPGLSPQAPASIQHAGSIEAEAGLKNARVKITLDRLRVAQYPGGGQHRVLFDFYAQNQLPGEVENLHFNATYRVQEGEQAAITGNPIFIGLNVGTEGVAFRCYTVNVKNDQDEAFLQFLESDEFRQGLKLIGNRQPVLAPFSQMAYNLTRSIARRNRNVPVQEFHMGLDFSHIATRARLAEGSYIAVQMPESTRNTWDWSQWRYHADTGRIAGRDSPEQRIPYNYLVFSISRYTGE